MTIPMRWGNGQRRPVAGHGNGNGNGEQAPTIGLAIALEGQRVSLNETPGPDLVKLKMLAASFQTILNRMEQGVSQSGLWLPPGAR